MSSITLDSNSQNSASAPKPLLYSCLRVFVVEQHKDGGIKRFVASMLSRPNPCLKSEERTYELTGECYLMSKGMISVEGACEKELEAIRDAIKNGSTSYPAS